jgi:SSS family solute:Na+ symporter
MIVGSTLAVTGILLPIFVDGWPLNGTVMMFISMVCAIAVFAIVSLATSRQPFDMQRMLHRGPYKVAEDQTERPLEDRPLANWKRLLLGYDRNFTRGDRFLSAALFSWTMALFGAFIVITLINLVSPWSDRAWWRWVMFNNIWLPIVVGVITTIWFTIGGLRDLKRLFARLRAKPRDAQDDGTVTDDPNPEDRAPQLAARRSQMDALAAAIPSSGVPIDGEPATGECPG